MSFGSSGETHPPLVAVVVLNWNGWRRTIATLESLSGVQYSAFRVLVVDNGSTDDSVPRLRSWLSALRSLPIDLVVEESNLGFADGCNLGIRQGLRVGADYVLLLNNDTKIRPDALTHLVSVAKEADAAIVGARIVDETGEVTIYTGNLWPRRLFFYKDVRLGNPGKSWWECSDCSGAAMLLRQDLLTLRADEEGQFLDGDFYMYCEDVDLCLWARSRGFKCVVARDAVVSHAAGQSSGGPGSARSYYYITRNRIRLANRWLDLQWRIAFHLYYAPSRLALALWRIISGRRPPIAATWEGLRDGYRSRYGQWQRH